MCSARASVAAEPAGLARQSNVSTYSLSWSSKSLMQKHPKVDSYQTQSAFPSKFWPAEPIQGRSSLAPLQTSAKTRKIALKPENQVRRRFLHSKGEGGHLVIHVLA